MPNKTYGSASAQYGDELYTFNGASTDAYVWIDRVRIHVGLALWTSNFTPEDEDLIYTVPGLDHLEGRIVSILADGIVLTPQVVSGGSITLTTPAVLIHAGLGYNSDMETLNIEVGLADGTMQGRKVHVSRVVMRLDNSRGGFLGPDFDHLYEIKGVYSTDVSTSLYSGDVKVVLGGGYSDGGRFCYRQSEPLPVTILGLVPLVTAGNVTGL